MTESLWQTPEGLYADADFVTAGLGEVTLHHAKASANFRNDHRAHLGHRYAGAPLRLDVAPETEARERVTLWKRSLRRRTAASGRARSRVAGGGNARRVDAVGCTVAPGFDFAQFELAPKGWEPE